MQADRRRIKAMHRAKTGPGTFLEAKGVLWCLRKEVHMFTRREKERSALCFY
jgi:hypothetical protein